MMKYLAIPVIAMSMVAPASAGTGDIADLRAAAAWNYDGYRVELAGISQETVGPFVFGDRVFLAEPEALCGAAMCDFYTLYALQGGQTVEIANVPRVALDPQVFAINGERMIYPRVDRDLGMVTVMELDLETLQEQVISDELIMNDLVDLKVFVDGTKLYFEPVYEQINRRTNKKELISSIHTLWTNDGSPKLMGRIFRYERNREEILDVRGDTVLFRMTFPTGHKQLWLANRVTDQFVLIPDTWTFAEGMLEHGMIQNDGTVTFVRDFTNYVYNPQTKQTTSLETQLNWFADNAYQRVGNMTAWIDPADVLHLRDESGVRPLGKVTNYTFRLTENRVLYAGNGGGVVHDIATGTNTHLSFAPTHVYGNTVIGTDVIGDVYVYNLETKDGERLGYGSDAVIADLAHAYWRGVDGNLYEGTMRPTVNGHDMLVKFGDSNRVYLVDGEHKIHWIASEAMAVNLFGATWKENVKQLPMNELTAYKPGSVIQTSRDLTQIR